MTSATTKRAVRWLTAVLALAMMLPAGALASHTDCNTSSNAVDPNDPDSIACPEFSPTFSATVDQPWVDTPANLSYRWGQADDQSAAVSVRYGIPRGWSFAVASVRAGQNASGVKADDPILGATVTCNDLYDGASPRNLLYGEGLSPNVGMQMKVGPARTLVNYGNSGGPNGRKPNISFLRWNAATKTADLCLYLFSFDADVSAAKEFILPARLAMVDGDPIYGWNLTVDLDAIARNAAMFAANASLLSFYLSFDGNSGGNWNTDPADPSRRSPVEFSRTPAEPETTALSATWQTCRDGLRAPGALAPGQTSCNHDAVLSVTAARTINISLPPTTPYALDFARLTGPNRLAGTDPYNTSPLGSGPKGDPTGGAAKPNLVDGFGLVTGTNKAPVTWKQVGTAGPGVRLYGPKETVRGYVFVVADPGDVDGRAFEYVVTQRYRVDAYNDVMLDANGDPVPDLAFDARRPCGSDGTDDTCALNLSFPRTAIGGKILDGNSKYDLSLVTIYADGHRTDGRCDDGTGPGTICDPRAPGFNVAYPGFSTWEFLMRTATYSAHYLETFVMLTGTNVCTVDGSKGVTEPVVGNVATGGGIYLCAGAGAVTYISLPRFVLLVDYETKKADFVIWGDVKRGVLTSLVPNIEGFVLAGDPQSGSARSFSGSSNFIVGSGDIGVVSFGNFKPDGSASSFHYDGITNVAEQVSTVKIGSTPCASGFIELSAKTPGADASLKSACGVFTLWYPNNWTLGNLNTPLNLGAPLSGTCIGITVPTCRPVGVEEIFEGARV